MDKQSEDQCSSSSSSSSSSNPCPICLGPFLQESYLDSCFHKFCYKCILYWSQVVGSATKHSAKSSSLKCPLCKTENLSIIYDYDGISFHRHYFKDNHGYSSFFSKAHQYRLQCYYTEPGTLSDVVNVSRYWKYRKYLQPNRWLQSWLRREIQALLQEEDVDIIVHHIVGVIDSFSRKNGQIQPIVIQDAKQEEFKTLVSDAAKPFLAARTDRFVNELETFLASGFNVEAYDEVYKQQLGWIPNTLAMTTETTAADVECSEKKPVIPYLYIFDEDSDETD
ncbi:RING/U-box superfamily protein [Euphorbia peplus]|nr:RING/U-box superfamily protein [Euphorbia peplus]